MRPSRTSNRQRRRKKTSPRCLQRGTPSSAAMSMVSQRFRAWLSDNPDEAVLRWIFRSVVTVTVAVLAADLAATNGWITSPDPQATPTEIKPAPAYLELPGVVPSILAPWLP